MTTSSFVHRTPSTSKNNSYYYCHHRTSAATSSSLPPSSSSSSSRVAIAWSTSFLSRWPRKVVGYLALIVVALAITSPPSPASAISFSNAHPLSASHPFGSRYQRAWRPSRFISKYLTWSDECAGIGAPCATSNECCEDTMCYKIAGMLDDGTNGFCGKLTAGSGRVRNKEPCNSSSECSQGSCCQPVFIRQKGMVQECLPARKSSVCITAF